MAQEIQYSDILKKSFLTSWKNKFLWLFGFFIFFSLLAEEVVNFSKDVLFENISFLKKFGYLLNNDPVFFFLVLALIFVLLFLRTLSIGGLIKSLNDPKLYKQKKISEILRESLKYFWKLIGLGISLGIFVLFILVLLAFPVSVLLSLKATFFGMTMLTLAILILIPLLLLAFFLKKFGYIFVVLSGSKLKEALEFSYGVFSCYAKESLFMFFILFGITAFFFSTSFLLLLVVIKLTSFLTGSMVSLSSSLKMTGCIALWIIAITLIAWAFSFLNVFVQAAWLEFFSRISMQKNSEKLAKKTNIFENEISDPEAEAA